LEKLRVAITSGYASSKHAIALLHEANAIPHVQVVLLLQVKTFTGKRVKQLLRMYGWRDGWEKFKNIFMSDPANRFAEEIVPINDYLKERKINFKSTIQLCTKLRINVKKVVTLNDQAALNELKNTKIDLVIYAGGGILGKKFIESVRYGVLNAHSGPLPYFRGMNCMEWTLYYGVIPEITVHFIDNGIDTGPILKRFPMEVKAGDTIASLRGKSVVSEVKALLMVLSNFQNYAYSITKQDASQGVQFFIMHPFIKNILDGRLKRGWLPILKFDEFLKSKLSK
jgi:folate-dependent phosphoribosylglycinamide formyltransferase PurN